MKALTVYWNPETDQTNVEFTPDYHDLHLVAKIDVLQDVRSIVQEELHQKGISLNKGMK